MRRLLLYKNWRRNHCLLLDHVRLDRCHYLLLLLLYHWLNVLHLLWLYRMWYGLTDRRQGLGRETLLRYRRLLNQKICLWNLLL